MTYVYLLILNWFSSLLIFCEQFSLHGIVTIFYCDSFLTNSTEVSFTLQPHKTAHIVNLLDLSTNPRVYSLTRSMNPPLFSDKIGELRIYKGTLKIVEIYNKFFISNTTRTNLNRFPFCNGLFLFCKKNLTKQRSRRRRLY